MLFFLLAGATKNMKFGYNSEINTELKENANFEELPVDTTVTDFETVSDFDTVTDTTVSTYNNNTITHDMILGGITIGGILFIYLYIL